MRRAAHRDAIEPLCLVALDAVGATWLQLDEKDAPDLLVGYQGRTTLHELKSTLRDVPTEGQKRWHDGWRGSPVHVDRSPQELLRSIGAPFTAEVRAAIAAHVAKECKAVLGAKPLAKLNRRLVKSSVRSYRAPTAEVVHPDGKGEA